MIQLLPESQHTCFLLPAMFDAETCEILLRPEIRNNYKKAIDNYPHYYRNNERLVIDDSELAAQLFQKIAKYLPQELRIESENLAEAGLWKLKGLNERLRYCRYAAGQYFHRHLDGIHYRSENIQSKLTFMIYLNGAEDFEGGRTLFYKDRSDTEIWEAYTPQKGDLIIFDHNLWHEGEALLSGEKFVLRSDILYERVESAITKALPYQGHLGYIWSLLAWDEQHLLSGGRDKTIRYWNEKGQCLQYLYGHEHSVSDLAKIDDKTLASCSRDRTVILWEQDSVGQFSLLRRIVVGDATVLCLEALGAGIFACGAADSVIRLYDKTGTCLGHCKGHKDWVWDLCLIDEQHLLSASEDASLRLWNWCNAQEILCLDNGFAAMSLAFDAKKQKLYVGDLEGGITIWNWASKEKEQRVLAHEGLLRCLLLLPDGQLLSGSEDAFVKLWNTENFEVRILHKHLNFVQALALQGDSFFSAAYDGCIMQGSF